MLEQPDIASSTDEYASRFAGPAGQYLLSVQERALMGLVEPWRGGSVLDVGGGHAQLCGPLLDAGFRVAVLGSDGSCFVRPRRYFGDRVECVEGDLLAPPFPDRSFDVVVAIRMLAHIEDARKFVSGLCRTARHAVIVDYADVRSVNALVPLLYGVKKRMEGNTRPYRTYARRDLLRAFRENGFGNATLVGQFFWPMVLHRAINNPLMSGALEAGPRAFGLSRLFGSPMLLRMARQ